MKIAFQVILFLAIVLAPQSVLRAAIVLIDGFGMDALVTSRATGTRLRAPNNGGDGRWHARENTLWDLTAGELSVTPQNQGGYHPTSQGPIATLLDMSDFNAQGSYIRMKFDYDIGSGTLFFHLRGADDPGGQSWDLNLNSGFGHMYDDDISNPDVGTRYDLTDGQTVHTGSNTDHGESRGFREHTISLTGSGTYDVTFNISSYAVNDLADYEWIGLGFAHNGIGTDLISIANLELSAIPEPTTFLMSSVALSGIFIRRRRR